MLHAGVEIKRHILHSLRFQQTRHVLNECVRNVLIGSSMEHAIRYKPLEELHARHIYVLRFDSELMVVRKTATVHNQTAQRFVPIIARVESDSRSLTKSAQENTLRRNALGNLLVNESIDFFHALFHSSALVVSSIIP